MVGGWGQQVRASLTGQHLGSALQSPCPALQLRLAGSPGLAFSGDKAGSNQRAFSVWLSGRSFGQGQVQPGGGAQGSGLWGWAHPGSSRGCRNQGAARCGCATREFPGGPALSTPPALKSGPSNRDRTNGHRAARGQRAPPTSVPSQGLHLSPNHADSVLGSQVAPASLLMLLLDFLFSPLLLRREPGLCHGQCPVPSSHPNPC